MTRESGIKDMELGLVLAVDVDYHLANDRRDG